MALKIDTKLEGKLTRASKNRHEEFDKFWLEHSKISQICTLIGCFWSKYIMFELKRSIEELYLMALNIDAEFEEKLTAF